MTKPINHALEILNKLYVYRKMTKTKDGEVKSELACLKKIPLKSECVPSRLNLKKYIYLNSRDLTINEIEDVIQALRVIAPTVINDGNKENVIKEVEQINKIAGYTFKQ
ncbi:hypothetical protein CD117_00590 [Mammaliicoccus sciuri]|uniref:Uncharacterized protein n=1 Tax=Mammaliicoccus sciuri TaxID=1296 RepID=A0AAJ4VJC9_MAMSC|nr:hypothetical protein [Mammaliicoccus sciuri]RTX75394.1 hypothetical protein CD117_00590 [Mammaliicoccus sciuri]